MPCEPTPASSLPPSTEPQPGNSGDRRTCMERAGVRAPASAWRRPSTRMAPRDPVPSATTSQRTHPRTGPDKPGPSTPRPWRSSEASFAPPKESGRVPRPNEPRGTPARTNLGHWAAPDRGVRSKRAARVCERTRRRARPNERDRLAITNEPDRRPSQTNPAVRRPTNPGHWMPSDGGGTIDASLARPNEPGPMPIPNNPAVRRPNEPRPWHAARLGRRAASLARVRTCPAACRSHRTRPHAP